MEINAAIENVFVMDMVKITNGYNLTEILPEISSVYLLVRLSI